MKTRIKKIILLTVALLFLATGISFAHQSYNNPPGNAYGHYKSKGYPVWHRKQPAPRYVKEHHRYYDNYQRWSGNDGSVFKLSVAEPGLAFKIVVKNR